jgi:hypothetical protein
MNDSGTRPFTAASNAFYMPPASTGGFSVIIIRDRSLGCSLSSLSIRLADSGSPELNRKRIES